MNQYFVRSVLSRIASLPVLLSLALGMLGITVMSGWLLQVQAMVEFRAGMIAMVFNTALCFTCAAVAVGLPAFLRRPLPHLQLATGAFLILLSCLILIEQALDRSLGVDWAFLHTWLVDGNIRPGRMAPNSALGFLVTGLCLVLLPRAPTRQQELGFQALVFLLLAIGLTGLVSYILAPEQLFGWARSARMAVHTGLGMAAMSLALWSSWHAARSNDSTRALRLDEKIGFISAGILAVATVTAGMTGFVFQKEVVEQSLRERLQMRLDGTRHQLQTEIDIARKQAENAFEDARLAGLAATPRNPQLGEELRALVRRGARSASLYGADGRLLAEAGEAARAPELSFPLPSGAQTRTALLWTGELQLETSAPLLQRGQVVARLHLRFSMPLSQEQLSAREGMGNTGEMFLCTGDGQAITCLPNGRQDTVLRVRAVNMAGKIFPVAMAIQGQSGIANTVDVHGNNVMAAYAPVSPLIGLVVKQDSAELYAAIRDQLKVVVPALLLLMLLGTVLMRSLVRPITRRLIVSERQAREKQLEMNILLASVGEGIWTFSEDSLIESFNEAACRIFGHRAEEVIGQPIYTILPPEVRAPVAADLADYLVSGVSKVIGKANMEMPGIRKDGRRFTLELSVNEIPYENRRVFVTVARDITERKQHQEKLTFMAQHDALTGLPNRALFIDRLAGALARARRSRGALAVMFLDLDGFKHINDTLGHHCGDLLLRQFGERLGKVVRRSDTVARLAGDEFTVILEDLNEAHRDMQAVAEKMIDAMQTPFQLAEHTVHVTTSIGIAIHAEGTEDVEILLRRADAAMYRAKHSGKNRWSL